MDERVALVTGGSHRIGAAIIRDLHAEGLRVAIHYRSSREQAMQLAAELNRTRAKSATTFQADFDDLDQVFQLGQAVIDHFGRLDVLINNASEFLPSSIEDTSADRFGELFGVHVKAPYFLTQSVLPQLLATKGCILNITDIYANRPLANYSLYCAAKAALESLTKSLALELAPNVRVNAIAPGAILWVEGESACEQLIENTPLKRLGDTKEITAAVRYLVFDATFTTGNVLTVDGGRSITPP